MVASAGTRGIAKSLRGQSLPTNLPRPNHTQKTKLVRHQSLVDA